MSFLIGSLWWEYETDRSVNQWKNIRNATEFSWKLFNFRNTIDFHDWAYVRVALVFKAKQFPVTNKITIHENFQSVFLVEDSGRSDEHEYDDFIARLTTATSHQLRTGGRRMQARQRRWAELKRSDHIVYFYNIHFQFENVNLRCQSLTVIQEEREFEKRKIKL